MPIKKYTIELKVDATDEGHEAMTQITRQYARDLLSSAMLASPGKHPQIMCRSEDNFYTQEDIEVMDPTAEDE